MEIQIGIKDTRSLVISALDYIPKEELELMLEGLEKIKEINNDKGNLIDSDILRIKNAIQRKSS